MNAVALTDVGQSRKMNQDYVFSSTSAIGNLPNLFIVADGMGGHNAGDYASKYTVEVFVDAVRQADSGNPITIMKEAVDKANRSLIDKAEEASELTGMGTTLVVATIIGTILYISNVGDSRLYIINDEARQITRDHSLVEEMVNLGELDKRSAKHHEKKNIITRAIGADKDLTADFFEIELSPNDTILLCSDGLSNMIDDEVMKEIITKDAILSDKANKLIEEANINGGKDNIAVILIEPNFNEVNLC